MLSTVVGRVRKYGFWDLGETTVVTHRMVGVCLSSGLRRERDLGRNFFFWGGGRGEVNHSF